MRGQSDAGQESDLRTLAAENRQLEAENRKLTQQVSALHALLAVICTFAKLPLPVKDQWQEFYREGLRRLERIQWMASEMGTLALHTTAANRWESLLNTWTSGGLSYEPDPGALPKPGTEPAAVLEHGPAISRVGGSIDVGAWVLTRYPRKSEPNRDDRESWPWWVANVELMTETGEEWQVMIWGRELAELEDGTPAPEGTPDEDLHYPLAFRDRSELRLIDEDTAEQLRDAGGQYRGDVTS